MTGWVLSGNFPSKPSLDPGEMLTSLAKQVFCLLTLYCSFLFRNALHFTHVILIAFRWEDRTWTHSTSFQSAPSASSICVTHRGTIGDERDVVNLIYNDRKRGLSPIQIKARSSMQQIWQGLETQTWTPTTGHWAASAPSTGWAPDWGWTSLSKFSEISLCHMGCP